MPQGKMLSAEQIIARLSEAEVELARGKLTPEAAKKIGVRARRLGPATGFTAQNRANTLRRLAGILPHGIGQTLGAAKLHLLQLLLQWR